MKKKNSRKVYHEHPHFSNARLVLSFFILLSAFSILILYTTYQQNIFATQSFNLFIVLATIGLGLLAVLLFLVNSESAKK